MSRLAPDFFRADALVEQLYRGLADNGVGRVIDSILRADLVVLDELGFSPLDAVAANHLFRLVAAAYEIRSLVPPAKRIRRAASAHSANTAW